MPRLSDGTVLPSFLGVQDRARRNPGALMTMSDVGFRVGEVIAVHERDSSVNVSKNEAEYIVQVNHRNGAGTLVQTPYRCVLKDGFGSQGDHVRHSLRGRSAKKKRESVGNGALVLIACINGDMAQAVIIDCLRHPRRAKKDPQGRFFSFEFNGVDVTIADDGSLSLQVPGPTDVDGKPDQRDGSNHGSKVTLAANGDVTVDDQNGQSILVSPGSKRIEVKAGDHDTKVSGDWTLKASNVTVIADQVSIGSDNLNPIEHGIVLGGGIDTFTGLKFSALRDSSLTVKAKK